MNSWDLLWYYEAQNEEFKCLQAWNALWRKQLYNIEFPFSHARQLTKLLEELWVAKFDPSISVYYVNGWQKPILDGIRLWLLESLKQHHKNRWMVENILNLAFTDDWIEVVLTEEIGINSLKDKVRTTISQVAKEMI